METENWEQLLQLIESGELDCETDVGPDFPVPLTCKPETLVEALNRFDREDDEARELHEFERHEWLGRFA